jgi:hypothetical protein
MRVWVMRPAAAENVAIYFCSRAIKMCDAGIIVSVIGTWRREWIFAVPGRRTTFPDHVFSEHLLRSLEFGRSTPAKASQCSCNVHAACRMQRAPLPSDQTESPKPIIYATSLMTPPASLIFCSASLETNRVFTMKGLLIRPLPSYEGLAGAPIHRRPLQRGNRDLDMAMALHSPA